MAHRPHPGGGRPPDRGVWKHKRPGMHDPDVKLADFSYQNDDIAKEIIVKAWGDLFSSPRCWEIKHQDTATTSGDYCPHHCRRNGASALPIKPVTLKSAIVLTEAEYDDGWDSDDPDQVVFVLPNRSRATGNLLETAKMLMACVPNGI